MTSHDEGPRTSKSSSLSEELDSKILRGYCRVEELSSPDPVHTEPKVHAKEEEKPKDEQREFALTKDIAEDNPVLGQPRL